MNPTIVWHKTKASMPHMSRNLNGELHFWYSPPRKGKRYHEVYVRGIPMAWEVVFSHEHDDKIKMNLIHGRLFFLKSDLYNFTEYLKAAEEQALIKFSEQIMSNKQSI